MGTISILYTKKVMLAGFPLEFSSLTPDKKIQQWAKAFHCLSLPDVVPGLPHGLMDVWKIVCLCGDPHTTQGAPDQNILCHRPHSTAERVSGEPNEHCGTQFSYVQNKNHTFTNIFA